MNNLGNFISYKVKTNRLLLKEPIEIDSVQYNHVEKIILTSVQDKVIINDSPVKIESNLIVRLDLDDFVISHKDAALVVSEPLEDIMNALAQLNSSGYMGQPYLYEVKVKFERLVNSSISRFATCFSGDSRITELKELIKSRQKTQYDTLYRMTLSNDDAVSRFMLLYSILAIIKGPLQSSIDSYIKIVEPGVVMKNSTKPNASKQETIYSHYRNHVGHTNPQSDLSEIRETIETLVDPLNKIVIKAINGITTP